MLDIFFSEYGTAHQYKSLAVNPFTLCSVICCWICIYFSNDSTCQLSWFLQYFNISLFRVKKAYEILDHLLVFSVEFHYSRVDYGGTNSYSNGFFASD